MTKAPTTDQLIVLAGLDKSPDEVIDEQKKRSQQARKKWYSPWARFKRWLKPKPMDNAARIEAIQSVAYLISHDEQCLAKAKKEIEDLRREDVLRGGVPQPFNPAISIREVYTAGLKRAEEFFIGPESEWFRAKVNLESRLSTADYNLLLLSKRLKDARIDGEGDRVKALENTVDRLTSSIHGLTEARDSMSDLIERTRAELRRCYVLVDSMSDSYADAELIHEVDLSISDNTATIDHAKQLRDQAYGKIARQMAALAGVVTAHTLQITAEGDNFNLPKYLDEVTRAGERLAVIGEP